MARYDAGRPLKSRRERNVRSDPFGQDKEKTRFTSCPRCEAVHYKKRWYSKEDFMPSGPVWPNLENRLCPGCQAVNSGEYRGVLVLQGEFLRTHKEEVERLATAEAKRAERDNPLEKIVLWNADSKVFEIRTTNAKLAQRIGRAVKKAYQGELFLTWSDNNRFLQARWSRAA